MLHIPFAQGGDEQVRVYARVCSCDTLRAGESQSDCVDLAR
jgi:hypothetical protein